MRIVPRLEGALDDMSFLEIKDAQETLGFLQPGTPAYAIGLEKFFAKKNPDWGLKRTDFQAQAPEAPVGGGGLEGVDAVTGGLDKTLAAKI